jgi:hypothetical protein
MEPIRERQVTIPKAFLEAFTQEPRIVLPPFPGLWPVDMRLLRSDFLEQMINDEEFNARFQVMIVPKA